MKTKIKINGGTLKWIAIILMAVDHVGAAVIENFVLNAWGNSPVGSCFQGNWNAIFAVDKVLRYIGRPAFPIFCFLLIEGFLHTRDVKKYALRLGIFTLISEIPFDLALKNQLFDWSHQNVFATLLIGLLTIWAMKYFEEKKSGIRIPAQLLLLAAGAGAAELLQTDYGAYGVCLIVVLYLSREKRWLQCAAGAVCFAWEYTAPLAFIPIYFYNGERGRQPKWFFYWFYPAHLLLYYVIGAWIIPMVMGVI